MTAGHISHESFEILDAVERRGSFAKAAEELDKATSAISYGVQKLEQQLGITIFTRQGRRSVLTPAGQLLLQEGRKILAASARLADRAIELANGWETSIRIGLEGTFDAHKLFTALAQFQESYPGIEVDVRETLLSGGWEALEHHQVDLLVGAVAPVPAHRGLRTLRLGPTDLVPVISRRHPQAAAALAEGQYDTIALVVNHDTATTAVRRSAGLQLQERAKLYVQTMEQKMMAIQQGLGIGHLPRHRIAEFLNRGELVALDVASANPEQYLAWQMTNRGKGLQELVRKLSAGVDQAMGNKR